MRDRRLIIVLPFVALAAVLLVSYLSALPVAVKRARRSPCEMVRLSRPPNPLPASELRFTTLEGKALSVAELRGRLVLVNFWLTTCPPCLEEMPSLLELASRFEHRQLTLLLVATDKKAEEVKAFLQKNPRLARLGRNALYVHDPGGVVAKRLGTEKFPETYLVAPDGRLTDRVIGGRDWSVPSVADCLYGRIP